jgi:putative chitinase
MDLDKLNGSIPDIVISQIQDVIDDFEINTELRLAHFLAQCAHESGSFRLVKENLNYSADGLHKIFGKYFPGNLANSYARIPEKIGSRVYANRLGNGDEASEEGYEYRGRGYIQITGKNNYKNFGDSIGVDVVSDPDLVATDYPLLSAAWFWNENNLNDIADLGATDDVVTKITKRVNGGTNGLSDRLLQFNKIYPLLTS